MIEIISGKPRGGKSLFCQQERIIAELVHGNRPVLTNLAVVVGELNAYLQEHHPAIHVNLHKRLYVLSDEQVRCFWRYWLDAEGRLVELPVDHDGKVTDWKPCASIPAVHVIDELHWYFNAREWMKTGKDALTYLSMHGKLGCDVIGITQAVGNVDKQFRVLAQQFTYLRNLSYERFGIFRSADCFLMTQHTEEPKGMFAKPQLFKMYKLDKAIAGTYETAKGVGGISGLSGADRNRRKPGIALPWLIGGLAGIVILAFTALAYWPRLMRKGISLAVTPKAIGTNTAASLLGSNFPPSSVQGSTNKVDLGATVSVIPDGKPSKATNGVFLTGMVKIGFETTIYLSDGSEVSSNSKRVGGFNTRAAMIDGIVYSVAPPLPPSPAGIVAPAAPVNTVVQVAAPVSPVERPFQSAPVQAVAAYQAKPEVSHEWVPLGQRARFQ